MGFLIGALFFNFYPPPLEGDYNQWISYIFGISFRSFFITVLIILLLTDLKKMFIPDRIVLPSIVIGLFSLTFFTVYKIAYLYFSLVKDPVGMFLLPPKSDYFIRHAYMSAEPFIWGLGMAILIGGFFLFLFAITKGRGMGGGDVKLGAFLGLALGFPQSLVALILSFLSGAAVSIGLIILGKKHFGQSIPFGPFLVLGALIALFFGNQIVSWYLSLSINGA